MTTTEPRATTNEKATPPRTNRLVMFESKHFQIGTVKTMDDLKQWMDETCDTFCVDPEISGRGFFRAKCDGLLDELRTVSIRGFEQHEFVNNAKNIRDHMVGRNSIKAAIANDDVDQLRTLMEILKPPKNEESKQTEDDSPALNITSCGSESWLAWAAASGAMKCLYFLTTKYVDILKEGGYDTNENLRANQKSLDPVCIAIEEDNLNILSHLLCWSDLNFKVNMKTIGRNLEKASPSIQEFLEEWRQKLSKNDLSTQLISPFSVMENRQVWNEAEEDLKKFHEEVMQQGKDRNEAFNEAIAQFEGKKEEIRQKLKALEVVIRELFLRFEEQQERERFLETMKNNPAMRVWDDSFSTYNSVMSLAASRFGTNAWNKSFRRLSTHVHSILKATALRKQALAERQKSGKNPNYYLNGPDDDKKPQILLPLYAPQPIDDLITSYKHIYKTQEALRFVLLDIAALTSAELYCGAPKGLARTVEKVSLSMIFNVIKKRRPVEEEQRPCGTRLQRDQRKAQARFNEMDLVQANLVQLLAECDDLWDLWDYARGMLIYNTLEGIHSAISALNSHKSIDIISISNHFKEAHVKSENGWQDIMVHVKLKNLPPEYPLEKSLVCEIQLALKPLVVARRSLGGHEAYSLYRLAHGFKRFIERIDRIDTKPAQTGQDESNELDAKDEEEKQAPQLPPDEDAKFIFDEVRTSPMIMDRAELEQRWEVAEDRIDYIKSLYKEERSWTDARKIVENHEAYLGKRFSEAEWEYFWGLFGEQRDDTEKRMSLGLFVSSRVFHERASFNVKNLTDGGVAFQREGTMGYIR